MNLILIRPEEVNENSEVVLRDRRFRHIKQVLKAGEGKMLRVGLLNGPRGEGFLQEVTDQKAVMKCKWYKEEADPFRIRLILAMPRPRVLRRLLPQLSALGISEIIICGASRVERSYLSSRLLRPPEYEPLLEDGLVQASRTRMPSLEVHEKLGSWLRVQSNMGVWHSLKCWVAEPGAVTKGWLDVHSHDEVVLAIGPEGGWIEEELLLFEKCGFERLSIGERALKTETACVAALGALMVIRSLPSVPLQGR